MAKPIFSILMLLFLCTYLLGESAHAGGFAAGPSKMYFNKVLRNGYAQQDIYLYNPEEVITDVEVSSEGSFSGWIFFYPGKKITIPPKSNYILKTYIEPHADISNGIYNGTISIVSKPRRISTISGHGLAIETAITLLVYVDITGEQILKYDVKDLSVQSAEVDNPITFSFTGINQGNVRTRPQVMINIYNWDKSVLVKSDSFTGEETLPTTEKTYLLNVSSKELPEGQYWANITVFASGYFAGNRFLTFDIAKKGSLSRKGELLYITVNKPWVQAGDITRIDAIFKNIGAVPVSAKFKGEVYVDDTLVDTLESDQMDVLQGSSANLTVYYTPKRPGKYLVSGVVYYSGKMTYEKGTVLNVLPLGSLPEEANILEKNLSFALAAIVIILTLLYLAHSSGKDRASKYETMKIVSGRLDNVESSLDKMTHEAKRMSTKLQRLKSSRS